MVIGCWDIETWVALGFQTGRMQVSKTLNRRSVVFPPSRWQFVPSRKKELASGSTTQYVVLFNKAVCVQNCGSFSADGGSMPKTTSLSPIESTRKIIWVPNENTSLFWVTRGDDINTGDSLNNYVFEVLRISCCMWMPVLNYLR